MQVQEHVRAAIDDRIETPKTSADLADLANNLNASDPIPALGGQTRDEIRLRNSGRISMERIDDDLFAAVMAGDETHVRARLGGADKPLSEAEEILLVRTRRHEEEIAYAELLEQAQMVGKREEHDDLPGDIFFLEAELNRHHAVLVEGIDAYGGHYDRRKALYHDRFGGIYDAFGYRRADGSYQTAAGDYFHAGTGTVRLAIGGQAEILPGNLADVAADVMRLACHIAEIRGEARLTSPQAVAEGMEALEGRARDRFGKLAMEDDFRAAAADSEGGALKFMSCPLLTRKDLRMAADIVNENLCCGRDPHQLMQYHYKNILNMKDDAEDALAAALKSRFDHVDLPSISDAANGAFARYRPADVGFSLKDKADEVFGKPEIEIAPAVIAGAQARYRNALNRSAFRMG